MNCKNHPGKLATYKCMSCAGEFCSECVQIRMFTTDFTAQLCKGCGGKCESLSEDAYSKKKPLSRIFKAKEGQKEGKIQKMKAVKKAHSLKPRFFRKIPGILFFPLKGKGLLVIIGGGVLIYLFLELSRIFEAAVPLLWTALTTYYVVYLYKVLEDSAGGSTRLKNFPNFDYWISTVKQLALIGLAIFMCLGPANIYFIAANPEVKVIYTLLMSIGLFLLPAFFARITLIKKINSLNPLGAINCIRKAFFAYTVTCIFLVGSTFLLFYLLADILMEYDLIGRISGNLLLVYILLIQVRCLGIFTHYFSKKTEKLT